MRCTLSSVLYICLSLLFVISPAKLPSRRTATSMGHPSAHSVKQLIAQEGPRRTLELLARQCQVVQRCDRYPAVLPHGSESLRN